MDKLSDQGPQAADNASARVAEISQLYQNIRASLVLMMAQAGPLTTDTPKPILNKMNELQSAHLKVLAAEEAFHAHQKATAPDEDIDYDDLRADIGRQIDRIRPAHDPD